MLVIEIIGKTLLGFIGFLITYLIILGINRKGTKYLFQLCFIVICYLTGHIIFHIIKLISMR